MDFDQDVISVRFQLERKAKGAAARRLALKTKASSRDVEALPELIALLKKHKAEAFARGHARPEDYVFCTEQGRPLMHRNLSRDFATAGERAGLNPKEGEEGQSVSLHDLRHTAICRWIAAGLDVVEVQRQAGHANPATRSGSTGESSRKQSGAMHSETRSPGQGSAPYSEARPAQYLSTRENGPRKRVFSFREAAILLASPS